MKDIYYSVSFHRSSIEYRGDSYLAQRSILGATMNIWLEELHKAEDQLFLTVI